MNFKGQGTRAFGGDRRAGGRGELSTAGGEVQNARRGGGGGSDKDGAGPGPADRRRARVLVYVGIFGF